MAKMCVRVNSTYMEFTLTQEVELELRNTFKYFGVYLFIGCTENTKTEQMFDRNIANYILYVL